MKPLLLLFLLLLCGPVSADCIQNLPVLHVVESVAFQTGSRSQRVQARVDTGATYSSMDIHLARRLGLAQRKGRYVQIKNAHGSTRRKLIRVRFELKNKLRWAEFSLIDRSKMNYPVLLGRSGIQGFLVDPSPLKKRPN